MNSKTLSVALLVVAGILLSTVRRLPAQESVDLLITGGQVFDTAAGKFRPNSGLAIRKQRFASVKADAKNFQPKKHVKLKHDQYVLPGFIDCHAHYNVRLIRRRREEFSVMPIVYLANGATVTFSCGEFAPEKMYQLRRDIDSGKKIGPRLLNSGPYFGRARPGWRGRKTKKEIFEEVDFWAGKGVGGFKAKAIGPAELKLLIERAHHHGLTVTGHLDSGRGDSVNPRDAVEMGIDRIEHFIGGDAMPNTRSAYGSLGSITSDMPAYKRAVEHFMKNKTVFDATLTAYGYFGAPEEEFDYWFNERLLFTPFIQKRVKARKKKKPSPVFAKIYQAKQKTIGEFHRMGGTITLGTDHVSDGNHLPGFGIHRELDAFVRNGISELDALKIATINGARALNIDKDHGSIENGKYADLFIIQGNPLKKIRNTRNVQTVVTRGKMYDSKKLLESVKGKLGPKDESEIRAW